jgi:hypothetical protein
MWHKLFKAGEIYFGSQFQRVWSMVTQYHGLEQNIMTAGMCSGGKLLISWQRGSRK